VKPRRPPTASKADPRSTWNGVDARRLAKARERLAAGLSELSLSASAEQQETLLGLAALLERWAHRINLTAHRDVESIVSRLVLDAAALGERLPPARGLVDLGSGAGFPGLPLAVLRPACPVLLVEAREKRHHFQRAAVRELGLANAVPLLGRAETLEAQPQELAIAQAMAQPGRALAWMKRWTQPGGWIAIPGGESPPQIEPPDDVVFERIVEYQVPGRAGRRTLWLGRRRAL
jgi:16S rRNA (guanine527-N7)-methyltransferase